MLRGALGSGRRSSRGRARNRGTARIGPNRSVRSDRACRKLITPSRTMGGVGAAAQRSARACCQGADGGRTSSPGRRSCKPATGRVRQAQLAGRAHVSRAGRHRGAVSSQYPAGEPAASWASTAEGLDGFAEVRKAAGQHSDHAGVAWAGLPRGVHTLLGISRRHATC